MCEALQIVSIFIEIGVLAVAICALNTWRKQSTYEHKSKLFNDLSNCYYAYKSSLIKLLSDLKFIQLYLTTNKSIGAEDYKNTLLGLENSEGAKVKVIFQEIVDLESNLSHARFKIKLFDQANHYILDKNIVNLVAIFTKIKNTSEFVTFGDWFYSESSAEGQINAFEAMDTDLIKSQIAKELSNFEDTLAVLYRKI